MHVGTRGWKGEGRGQMEQYKYIHGTYVHVRRRYLWDGRGERPESQQSRSLPRKYTGVKAEEVGSSRDGLWVRERERELGRESRNM